MIVARRAELLDGLARELVERYRVAVEVLAADLTDPGQRAEVEGRLRAEPVELLVNNAATAPSERSPTSRSTTTSRRSS